jgi:prepilin-type N-terminal cleavage/methylation domain-containing protein
MKHKKCYTGFTLIELLLVIGIIAILAVSATPMLSNMVLRYHLEISADKVLSTLAKAQSYGMDQKNNSTWGVCFIDHKIRLYQNNCQTGSFIEDMNISSTVELSNFSDLSFDYLGEPTSPQNIILTTQLDQKNVTINYVGVIDVK